MAFLAVSCIISVLIFYPIFTANEVIIPYGLHPFDICHDYPDLWKAIKFFYIITFIISNLVISNFLYIRFISNIVNRSDYLKNRFFTKEKLHSSPIIHSNSLNLLIGFDKSSNSNIYIPESGLYQNFLVTGTIGSGKTSSAMYPFTKQLMEFNSKNPNSKMGMLILDVKGNYFNQVKKYAKDFNLLDDLIVIGLNSKVFYNPLHKPNLKPQVLANRLKTILTLFSLILQNT